MNVPSRFQEQRVRCRKREYAFKHGARLGHVAQGQIGVNRGNIAGAGNPRTFKNRFHFRSKDKAAFAFMIVERLLPAPVAGEERFPRAGVVQRESKHSVELFHAVPSPFFVGVNDHFGIRPCSKAVPLPDQLFVQLDIVVDFPVEANGQRAILVVDGLPAALEVDDREAPHPHEEAMRLILERAFTVRPAMGQAVTHPGQEPFLDKTGETKDSAHSKAMRLRSERAPVNQIDPGPFARRHKRSTSRFSTKTGRPSRVKLLISSAGSSASGIMTPRSGIFPVTSNLAVIAGGIPVCTRVSE